MSTLLNAPIYLYRRVDDDDEKLTEKLHSCIELIGRHCIKSNEKEKEEKDKSSCGRKEETEGEDQQKTSEIGTSSSSSSNSKHLPVVDFSPESATVNKQNLFQDNHHHHLFDSLDSTVCLDFNVKSSEEELVRAEVIHCDTAASATTIRDCWTLQQQSGPPPLQPPPNFNRTPRQPRPLTITTATTAAPTKAVQCPSKGVQQQKQKLLKFPEPELEDHRSIRKSLSRLLFRRGDGNGGPKNRTTTTTICDSSNSNSSSSESKPSCKFSSNTSSNSSSFCSKQASTAAPISRSAIAWQLLERINSRERGEEVYEGESFEEDGEEEEEEEGEEENLEEDLEEDVCSQSSSLDCCSSSSPPIGAPSFCSPLLLPTAYRANFILRENSNIYTGTSAHLCSSRQ